MGYITLPAPLISFTLMFAASELKGVLLVCVERYTLIYVPKTKGRVGLHVSSDKLLGGFRDSAEHSSNTDMTDGILQY